MNIQFETYEQAWRRRRSLRGEVDFTTMYVAHDAFARDLERLLAAAQGGAVLGSEARATWATFADMLHLHHAVEDAALWPRLRAAVHATSDRELLDAMEAEHAGIDPQMAAIKEAFGSGGIDALVEHLRALRDELRAHMLHEENEALPLLERTLGAEGWAAFGTEAHHRGGMRAAATVLPWSLDGASPEATSAVLTSMPLAARAIYRRFLAPKYARSARLH